MMSNRSEELAKLLGIEAKYCKEVKSGNDCLFCGLSRECDDIMYPDFEFPENFVNLLELISLNGFIEFEHNSGDWDNIGILWDAYSRHTDEETFKSVKDLGSGLSMQKALISLAKKQYKYISAQAQKINWSY